MFNQLSTFVQVKILKNGEVKLSSNSDNKANIFKLLKSLGYCYNKFDKKNIYYKRTEEGLKLVKLPELRLAFKDYLINTEFIDQDENVNLTDILDWFYSKTSIKQSAMLSYYLGDSLKESEVHELKMMLDSDYRNEFKTNEILKAFKNWKLKKSYSKSGGFNEGHYLFYKKIVEDQYLVFNHIQKDDFSCFDCWHARFKSESGIGKRSPLEYTSIQLHFDLERDFELIKNYVR